MIFQKILGLFEIYEASEAYYFLMYFLLKLFGIIIFLNLTFFFSLSYLIIIIFITLRDVTLVAKEWSIYKNEE